LAVVTIVVIPISTLLGASFFVSNRDTKSKTPDTTISYTTAAVSQSLSFPLPGQREPETALTGLRKPVIPSETTNQGLNISVDSIEITKRPIAAGAEFRVSPFVSADAVGIEFKIRY
jgi:hypothetical protein